MTSPDFSVFSQNESTEFLKLITANIHDVVGICDVEGNILYRSDNNHDLFGYSTRDVIGKNAFDYIHPDDRTEIHHALTQLVNRPFGERMSARGRYKHKNGHYLSIEISAKNMLDHPLIHGILITFHDETERMGLISAIERNNQRYKALIESTGHMVWSVNTHDYGLETFNSYMADYYRKVLNIELRIGLTPQAMLPEALVPYWLNLYDRVMREGSITVQYPMSSSRRVLMLTLNPMLVHEQITGISVFAKDETDRYEALAQIEAETEKYRALIDNMHDFVFVVDATDYTLKHFNPSQAEFVRSHYHIDIKTGMSSLSFMDPQAREFWIALFEQVKKEGHAEFENKTFVGEADIHVKVHYLEQHQEILVLGEDISAEKKYEHELEKSKRQLEETNRQLLAEFEKAISAISKLGELRDPYTAGHQKKVQDLCQAIALKLNLSADQLKNLSLGSLVHDIGKVYVPAEILNKPGKITDIEYRLIQSHALNGYNIIHEIGCDVAISTMILQHHERIDGSGYPYGITGNNLLIESKILAVADVVEAISSHRPYRPALGIDAALDEIKHYRGSKYDPAVVDTCLALFEKDHYQFPQFDYR